MPKSREPGNPFYVLLVLLGVAFLVTACAYGVMAYRAIAPLDRGEAGEHVLTAFLDRYGVSLLTWELALLGFATLGAMGLDRFRAIRRQAEGPAGAAAESDGESGRKNQ